MGYNARNDEIRDNVTRMQRDFQAQREAGDGPASAHLLAAYDVQRLCTVHKPQRVSTSISVW